MEKANLAEAFHYDGAQSKTGYKSSKIKMPAFVTALCPVYSAADTSSQANQKCNC